MTGLTGSTMDMGSRRGREVAGIGDNTGWGLGMDMVFIDSIQGICMQGSGLMGRATGVECIHAKMEAGMLGSSNGVLNTVLATTILGNFLIYLMGLHSFLRETLDL